MVGFIDPVGTYVQSANADRNSNIEIRNNSSDLYSTTDLVARLPNDMVIVPCNRDMSRPVLVRVGSLHGKGLKQGAEMEHGFRRANHRCPKQERIFPSQPQPQGIERALMTIQKATMSFPACRLAVCGKTFTSYQGGRNTMQLPHEGGYCETILCCACGGRLTIGALLKAFGLKRPSEPRRRGNSAQASEVHAAYRNDYKSLRLYVAHLLDLAAVAEER
jgi:hypothetical protein